MILIEWYKPEGMIHYYIHYDLTKHHINYFINDTGHLIGCALLRLEEVDQLDLRDGRWEIPNYNTGIASLAPGKASIKS